MTRTMHHPLTVISTNVAAGTVTGTGVYAEGKKVTVSAKPAKDWVFVGWYCDAELTEPMVFASGDWRRASQSVIVPEVRYVFAKFVTTDEDKRRISLSVAGEALSGAQTSVPMWMLMDTDGTRLPVYDAVKRSSAEIAAFRIPGNN